MLAFVYKNPWRVISCGSTWCILKLLINVGPTIGVLNYPQVSHAQWRSPLTKSTKNSAKIKPNTTGSGPVWCEIVIVVNFHHKNKVKHIYVVYTAHLVFE